MDKQINYMILIGVHSTTSQAPQLMSCNYYVCDNAKIIIYIFNNINTLNAGNSTITETPGSVNLGIVTAIVIVVLLAVALGAVVMIFVYLVTKHCRKTKANDDSEANTSSGKTFIMK